MCNCQNGTMRKGRAHSRLNQLVCRIVYIAGGLIQHLQNTGRSAPNTSLFEMQPFHVKGPSMGVKQGLAGPKSCDTVRTQ